MATIHEGFINKAIERSHADLHNKLEVANLETRISKKSLKLRSNINILNVYEKNLQNKDANKKSAGVITFDNKNKTTGDVIFHRNMRVLLIYGQFLGLNPVLGILGDDTSKLRFNFFSYKVLYSIFLLMFQTTGLMLCWRQMFEGRNIVILATTATTCVFLRVAMKWPSLVRDVAASKLEEYMDPRMRRKCNIATVVVFAMATVEYSFGIIVKITTVLDCESPGSKEDIIFHMDTQRMFKTLFDQGIQYNMAFGILCQVCDIIISLCLSFPDVCIICMSFYLSSILEMINKKIVVAKRTQTSLEFWKSMREDYSRATQLVRKFDGVFCGVIFISFADNLFFVCVELFAVFSNYLSSKVMNHQCPNYPSGSTVKENIVRKPAFPRKNEKKIPQVWRPFQGYENEIYRYYSFCFMFVRAVLMTHIAANVHSASIMVAPALYELPSSVYCEEVQRFIDQVHNEKVALSGIQFFYITKGLILSVGATLVTYVLVLLQFYNDEIMNKA